MLNTRKNIFSLNWTQGLAIEYNLNEFCASSVLELWLRIQLYVTEETSANYATVENYAWRWFRKDRKFCEKQKPFSPKMYIGSAKTHDCLHFCAYVCFHLISNVHIVRTFENTIPFQTLEKWHNVSYRYVKSETSNICRTGAWLLKPFGERVEENDIYYLVKTEFYRIN